MTFRTITQALVVDRSPLYRAGIGVALQKAGVFVVGEATNATDALREAKTKLPHLCVVNSVTDAATQELILKLRREPSLAILALVGVDVSHLPILSESANAKAMLAAGADGVLPRLASGEALGVAIEQLRKGERAIAPEFLDQVAEGIGPDMRGIEPSLFTAKELELLALLARGMSNRDIAIALMVGLETVKTHIRHIFAKLDVKNRRAAIERAIALGFLT